MLTSAQRASTSIKIPYGEATFSATIANNTYSAPTVFTSVVDNGLQTLGFNIMNAGAYVPLAKTGAWLVNVSVAWPANSAGYRAVSMPMNYSGGNYGQDVCLPFTTAFTQTTQGIIVVATNPGYAVGPQLYQNSGVSLTVTGTMRAVYLGGITP